MAFGFARFDLTTITKRLELPEISADTTKPVALTLRFLGVGNRDWEAWQFARDAAAGEQDPAKKKPGAERLAEVRAGQRDVLAAVGLIGWENVIEDDGTPVAFSAEAAARLASALHDAVPVTLAKIAEWAMTRSNFTAVTSVNPATLGKE